MEKKIYSRPNAAEECFTPNQYVASCTVEPVIPTGMDKDHFYIDGLDTAEHSHSHTPDGKCAASTEHTSRLKEFSDYNGGLEKFLKDWKQAHVDQGFYDLTTSNACNGQNYTNTSYFSPVVIIHGGPTSSQFYFLANGYVNSDDPWDYITQSQKNHS
ncbi:MAG: hypothetical protein IKH95_01905 [Bacteroidaceae bacterium]|nr:hypothetical protein [Bacteroidaceae bacterium]